jgi:hypothetical protein
MFLGLVLLAGVVGYLWYERSVELFLVSVRDGRVLLVRGAIPQGLLNDLQGIAQAAPPVERGSIRAVRAERGVRLVPRGFDEGREQRLRNVLSLCPLSRLSAASPLTRKTVGQWLGIAWVAWLFDRRAAPPGPPAGPSW